MKLSIKGQGYSFTLVKGHSDFIVKCLTFGLYTQVSDSGPHALLFHLLWCLFFTNTVQTMLKKAINMGRKGMALNCHGPLWAEMAMGRIDQRLLFAAKNFDSQ